MSLMPAVSFLGFITVTASTNDEIKFKETDGVTPVTSTATLTAGTYWPDSAISAESMAYQIGTDMTAASAYGATYTCTFNTATGYHTITATGGTLTGFYLMLTATETDKFFTGGDAAADAQGLDHFGFYTDSSYPAYALSVTSDTQVCNSWFPQGPLLDATTIEGRDHSYRSNVVQTETLGHKAKTRDFSPRVTSSDVDYSHVVTLSHAFLSDGDRIYYQTYFWSPYAKTGARFRYHPDRSDLVIYTEVVLWEDSASSFAPTRLPGYPHFSQTMKLKRYKS